MVHRQAFNDPRRLGERTPNILIWAARTAELIGRVQAQIGDTSRARGSGPVTRAGSGASPRFPDPARFRGGMSRYSSLVTR